MSDVDPSDAIAEFYLLASAVVGGVSGAAIAWTYAPSVGGEFWPYIRVGATIVGALVGARVAMILAALALFVVAGFLLGVREVTDR